MKYQAKSMMSLNEMAGLAIEYEGDGYVTGYPIVSGDDTYILNGVIEANEEYIAINQWVPVFPESLTPVSPSLTADQQVVLEELKTDQGGWDPFFTIWHLMEEKDSIHMPTKEQYQVLAAFAEWGLSKEESAC